MPESRPNTRTMQVAELSAQLLGSLDEVHRGEARIVIEREGIPIAVLVSPEDLPRLVRLDRQLAERRRILEAMREPFRDVPDEEIEREVAKAVAEVRDEMRAEREALLGQR